MNPKIKHDFQELRFQQTSKFTTAKKALFPFVGKNTRAIDLSVDMKYNTGIKPELSA